MKTTSNPSIAATNWRLWVAIQVCKLVGRTPETMAEIRDALNSRRNMRERHVTKAEAEVLRYKYLQQHAPDLLTT